MIQELSDKIWNNPRFHEASRCIEHAWLRKEFGNSDQPSLSEKEIGKLIQAAAILAWSSNRAHRMAAFRVATCAYDLFGTDTLPLDQALRVVLSRLGNFPSFGTRKEVEHARGLLPLALAAEEITAADRCEITVDRQKLHLTHFQLNLWSSLKLGRRIAMSAPTSAGKSFVLQKYLVSLFSSPHPHTVIYIVPTRALIAQVAADLADQFINFSKQVPQIITMPVDSDTELPVRAIYVLTQERVQIALAGHTNFAANVVVVDEAQSIADGARGVLLQWVIDDLLVRNPTTQILFASPNIRNLDVFSRLFGLGNVEQFASVEPTVAQNFLVVTIESATKGKISISVIDNASEAPVEVARRELGQTIAGRVDQLVHVAAALGAGQANIVYANGAAEAEKIAFQLADLFSDREATAERSALSELAREAVHPNYILVECVKRGIAFHYGNIPTQLRRAIEDAVSAGLIDYLVCTSTLLQGVNLPVKNIFICAPEKGKSKPLESTEFWNLSGRAGRLRREFQGNIYLINYFKWKTKPLDGPKETIVVPAIEQSIRDHQAQLIAIITDQSGGGRKDDPALETAFVRLYTDHKRGELQRTLDRIGVSADRQQGKALSAALVGVDERVSLPFEILQRTPSISAHKQQNLYDRLWGKIIEDSNAAKALIPLHPRESEAFQSYVNILKWCYEIIAGIDTEGGLHRFHALVALKWMRGVPLPYIIDNQIKRNKDRDVRTIIRETLELVETKIRFQAVRYFGCYNNLLVYALECAGMSYLSSSIPSLPLYLELGASDKTMISFISLGLSRVTAMKLNDISVRKDLDSAGARQWLLTRPLESLGLSPLLLAEVRKVMNL